MTYGELVDRIRDALLVGRPALAAARSTLTPVASRVAAAIAGEDHELDRPADGGPGGDLLPRDDRAPELFGVRLHGFDAAIERALREWEAARSWPRAERYALAPSMSEVSTTIHIDAPPQEVWDVVMDPQRLDEWVTIHREPGRHDGGDSHGLEMVQTLCLRGVKFDVRWELDRARRPAPRGVEGPRPGALARARPSTGSPSTATAARASTTATSSGAARRHSARSPAARSSAALPSSEADASLRRLKALVEKRRRAGARRTRRGRPRAGLKGRALAHPDRGVQERLALP